MSFSAAVEVHGHRGCRGLRPENTLPAFRHALALGVDVLELDVVLSADNQVVVSHEPWFSSAICRLPSGAPVPAATARTHNLYQLPYAAIQQYDCGLTQHPAFPEQQPEPAYKPLLHEVLAEAETLVRHLGRPLVRYSIELKSSPPDDGIYHPLPGEFLSLVMAVLQRAEVLDRVTLLCFDKRVLQEAHRRFPHVPLCLLVEDEMPLPEHLQELGFLPAVYGPHHPLVTPTLVHELYHLGVRLVPWTVNELPDMHRILSLHPAGITTDYPDRLLRLLGR